MNMKNNKTLTHSLLSVAVLGTVVAFIYFLSQPNSPKEKNARKIASTAKLVLPKQELKKNKVPSIKNKAANKIVQTSHSPSKTNSEKSHSSRGSNDSFNENDNYDNYDNENSNSGQAQISSLSDSESSYSPSSNNSSDFSDSPGDYSSESSSNNTSSNPTVNSNNSDQKVGIPTGSSGGSSTDSSSDSSNDGGGLVSSSSTPPETEDIKNAKLTGKVLPLVGVVSWMQFDLIRPVYAAGALTCNSPSIQLFDLKTMTPLADNPIRVNSISGTVAFNFDPYELNLNIYNPSRYLLRTTGCNIEFKRIVTSFFSDQDLDYVSTIISEIINSDTENSLDEINESRLDQLEDQIKNVVGGSNDLDDIADQIANNPDLNNSFENITGSNPDIIAYSAPSLTNVNAASTLEEGVKSTFTSNATHWSSDYTVAYEWILNDNVVSNAFQWEYTPNANTKTINKVELYVGSKNSGDNNVNRTKPHYYYKWDYEAVDTYPVTLPSIALSSTTPTASRNITLSVNLTDTMNADGTLSCDTLSKIAIVEDSATPIDTDFIHDCSSATINYTLQRLSDGSINVDIYAKDINDKITALSRIPVYLDNTNPVIAFTGIQSSYRADRTHPFDWTLTEINTSAALNFSIRFSSNNGATWSNLVDVAAADGPLINEAFATNILLPNISTSNALVEVSFTDLLGNSTTETQQIEIRAPSLSFSPSSYDFGNILTHATDTTTITINNTGLVDGESCAFSLSGTNSSEFSIDSNTCAGIIPASGSCTVDISATPNSKILKSATLGLTCGSDSLSLALAATGINNAPVAANNNSQTLRDNLSTVVILPAGSDVDNVAGDLTYKLTQDVAIGTLSNCLVIGSYSQDLICDYIAPVNFHGAVTLKYIVNDGDLDSVDETTFTLNVEDQTSTVPSVTPANFSAGTSTSQNPMTLTAADCDDIAFILIKESTTAPAAGDSGWQACSTAIGAITFDPSILNTQGFRTLRVFGKDAHDNISTYQSIDYIYDSMAPIIAIEDVPTLPWSITYPVKFKLTEATISGAANFTVEISLNGGSSWSVAGSVNVGSNGPHADKDYTFNYNVPSGTYYNDVLFKISLTDTNGLTGSSTSNSFRIVEDLGAPYIHTATFRVNGSITPPATTIKYVDVEFKAEDIDTILTHFCLRGNNTAAPALSDSCWQAFDAPNPGATLDKIIQISDYKYLLGFSPNNFKISLWVRDLAGNISSNADTTAGKDFVIMNYTPDPPPELSSLFVTNSNTPNNPVEDADLVFNNGDTVYISWRATDNNAFPNQTVHLSYSTDDINFNPIAPDASVPLDPLNNDANNCPQVNDPANSLDDTATGCYRWTFPLTDGQYFRIKVVISDDENQDTSITSVALNSNKFKILAGNVDPGTGASAKSAQLFPKSTVRPFTLAVSSDGKIFFNDAKRGLLYINPFTNVLEQLIPETGISTGDGGPVTLATANYIHKINMDYQDRLLVYDGQSIRRIDTTQNPMTIETIIGYKDDGTRGTNRSDIVLDPKDFKLESPGLYQLFQPLPNGDLWFGDISGSVSGGNLIRVYKGSLTNPRIESIRISGNGASSPPTTVSGGRNSAVPDMNLENIISYQIAFNKTTSNVDMIYAMYYRAPYGCSYYMRELIDTSTYDTAGATVPNHRDTCTDSAQRTTNDGNHYVWSIHQARLTGVNKLNIGTNSYDATFLGNGVHGTCADGTAATSCPVRITDFFVAVDGTFFFVDSDMIRVIDNSGNVQTLYGQSKSFGDGGLGQDARFGIINFIDHGTGDNVVMIDNAERIMREIRPNEVTNQVIRVAGNGVLVNGSFSTATDPRYQMLDSASWGQTFSFATNPSNGDIYFACTWHNVCRLNRVSNRWEIMMGQDGGSSWLSQSTDNGTTMDMGNYPASINGYFGGNILTGHYSWSGTKDNNQSFRLTNVSNSLSTYVAGKAEEGSATGCPSGAGTNCNLGSSRQYWSAITWDSTASKILFEFDRDRGSYMFRHLSGNSITNAFTYPEYFLSIVKVGSIIYGCTENNELKRWDTSTSSVTLLPIPGTAKCHGNRILYKNASGDKPNRLVFPFNQNGLQGIAEYFLN